MAHNHVGNMIDITVRSVYNQVHRLDVNQMSVHNLKQRISIRDGIPIEQQHLIYGGRVLQNDQLLSSYHIQNGDTLYLVCAPQSMSSFVSLPSLPSRPGSSHNLGASSRPNSLQILPPYLDEMRRQYSPNETGNHMLEVIRSTFNSPEEIPRAEQLARLLSSTRDMLINQTSQCLLELEGDLRHNLNVADPRVRCRTQTNAQRSGRMFKYLGAYFLELARTMMQVEMGNNRHSATVNVGPSLYITDDLCPDPLSIQREDSTFVSPRLIHILYDLYLGELHRRQHSARSSFPTGSYQNMPSQHQHEQDRANIRQHNNTALTDVHENSWLQDDLPEYNIPVEETATLGATIENVTGNMETGVHESSIEPSDENN